MEVIYKDKELIICHKMPGIPVQTSKFGQKDMVGMLKSALVLEQEAADVYVVHRLDQPVEGIIAFARTKQAAASLSRQLQENGMDKQYLALVEGQIEEPEGILVDYLLRDGKSNTSRVVPKGTNGAKYARLSYQALASITVAERPLSLVRVKLGTGRHHQIRVQLAHAGIPIAGDKKYNPSCPPGYLPIGLCATHLSFLHPSNSQPMRFSITPKGGLFTKIPQLSQYLHPSHTP